MEQGSAVKTAGKKLIVLCVDDEVPVLGALSRLLWREPFNLVLTQDPREALEIVGRGNVSLVIADHRMPGMSGTILLKAVKESSPQTGRMMLTAYPDSASAAERARGTIQCLLTKPWTDEDLRGAIRRMLYGEEKAAEKKP